MDTHNTLYCTEIISFVYMYFTIGVLVLLPCNRRTDVRNVAAMFVASAYSPGRNFTPIEIFLGKICSSVSSGTVI